LGTLQRQSKITRFTTLPTMFKQQGHTLIFCLSGREAPMNLWKMIEAKSVEIVITENFD
jgi:hypothetical protein